MINKNIKLIDLDHIFNYISEAIVISDEQYKIVSINDAAIKKLKLNTQTTVNTKTLMEYIPSQEVYKVQEAIKNNTNDYYEIILRREDGELFPALVSGTQLILQDKKYRVSTILDVSELKEKEKELISKSKEQLKQLKQHIINKKTSSVQELHQIKIDQSVKMQDVTTQLEENEFTIMQLNRKIKLLEKENESLNFRLKHLKENSFSFTNILDLELEKAKKFKTKFSLAMIAIDNYNAIKGSAKEDMIITALKRQFKNILKTLDIVSYEGEGVFYAIIFNSPTINITDVVKSLTNPKKIDQNLELNFSSGVAHFYRKDDVENIIYRCKKNLESTDETE